jgi:hypothetical protein
VKESALSDDLVGHVGLCSALAGSSSDCFRRDMEGQHGQGHVPEANGDEEVDREHERSQDPVPSDRLEEHHPSMLPVGCDSFHPPAPEPVVALLPGWDCRRRSRILVLEETNDVTGAYEGGSGCVVG